MIIPADDASTLRRHWDNVYQRLTPSGVSWYQSDPLPSLELIDTLGIPLEAAVLDVGGGASTLVDALLAKGFTDVSVLDLSATALTAARARVGPTPHVHWLHEDLLSWQPERPYDLWHDRAVLHFLVDPDHRYGYLSLLDGALRPGGHVVIGSFAPDGPDQCSGLPVCRYGSDDLAQLLGDGFRIVEVRQEQHTTPRRIPQAFTWIAAQRAAA